MNIHGTANNYLHTAADVTIRQRVARRRTFDLPGGILLWKAALKSMVWVLPVVLGINLWCASAIDSTRAQYAATQQSLAQQRVLGEELIVQRDRLISPVRVKITAAAKLSLYEPAAGQIQRM